jgi:hypothetical protein
MAVDRVKLEAMEDKVARLADGLSKGEQALLYRQLYNLGHRISSVESAIAAEVKTDDEKTGRRW